MQSSLSSQQSSSSSISVQLTEVLHERDQLKTSLAITQESLRSAEQRQQTVIEECNSRIELYRSISDQSKQQCDQLQHNVESIQGELQSMLGKLEGERQAREVAEKGRLEMEMEKKQVEQEVEGIRQERQSFMMTIRSLTDKVGQWWWWSMMITINIIITILFSDCENEPIEWSTDR